MKNQKKKKHTSSKDIPGYLFHVENKFYVGGGRNYHNTQLNYIVKWGIYRAAEDAHSYFA